MSGQIPLQLKDLPGLCLRCRRRMSIKHQQIADVAAIGIEISSIGLIQQEIPPQPYIRRLQPDYAGFILQRLPLDSKASNQAPCSQLMKKSDPRRTAFLYFTIFTMLSIEVISVIRSLSR